MYFSKKFDIRMIL